MAGFQKRSIDPSRVATVEAVTAAVPLGGDPRAQIVPPGSSSVAPFHVLGSIQDGYQVGQVYDVPVEVIKSNPVNPRALYTTDAIDKMAISLRESGQKISATGFVDEAGRVVLIEGETRLRGARAAGLPTLRVEIKTKPDSERTLYEEARAANVERRDQTPLDDALKWRELLDRKVYPTQSALAKALGVGEDDVSRILSLAKLPHRVVLAVADHPDLLTLRMLNAIREFCNVKGEQETLELILEASDKGWGYRDVEARRKAAETGPVSRKRAATESVVYGTAKGEIKTFEGGGRLQLVLKGLTADESKALTETLKEILQKRASD